MAKKSVFRVYFERIPAPFRNKYLLTASVFVIWITFFDRNDLISQRHLQRIIDDMETKKEYYKIEVESVKKEKEALFSDQTTLEKFAREKYLMKKDNEDIFVIVEEEKK